MDNCGQLLNRVSQTNPDITDFEILGCSKWMHRFIIRSFISLKIGPNEELQRRNYPYMITVLICVSSVPSKLWQIFEE